MSLLAGKTPPPTRNDEDDSSVDLSLVLKVSAVLGGVWLALVGLLFGIGKIVDPKQLPTEPEETHATDEKEDLGIKPQGYVPAEGPKSTHEGADLHIDKVVGAAAVLAIVVVLSILSLLLLFRIFEHVHPGRTSEANPLVTSVQIPPLPGVVADPDEELRQVRVQESLHLDHYGWIDAAHTTARIPIERAMTLWVQTYSAPAPTATPMPPASTTFSAPSTNAPPINSAPINAPMAPGVTELQMRQQKATEGSHAP